MFIQSQNNYKDSQDSHDSQETQDIYKDSSEDAKIKINTSNYNVDKLLSIGSQQQKQQNNSLNER